MDKYKGLSLYEVQESAREWGTNKITEKKKTTLWEKYWANFNDPIITILLVALGINIFFTFLGKVDWYECAGILIAVLIATFVSTISEFKNENTFRKLQSESMKIYCKAYRDGFLSEIKIDKIVKGDYILLQAGDMVPADGYLVSGKISVDQSALNGETKEVYKKGKNDENRINTKVVDFWDENSVYRGSTVCSGKGIMKVTDVGDSTLYGRLTLQAQEDERKSPLTVKLTKLAKDISKFGYIGATLVFLMFIFQKVFAENNFDMLLISRYFSDISQVISDIVEAIIICITVIVVAVPEGLPLMIAIVCSLNMRNMLNSNVLVRKIVGIETAGSINILFTDKTGTLTKGALSVTGFIDGDNCFYDEISDIPEKLRKMLLISFIANSGANYSKRSIVGGNGTEKALLKHIKKEKMEFDIQKLSEIPFSSETKYSMAEICGDFNGILIKGAPEIILSKCNRYYDKKGNINKFNAKNSIERAIKELAQKAERIIAFAIKEGNITEGIPDDLIFLSAVTIKDTIRESSKSAVLDVLRAGIQVAMVTGDRVDTASAIAKECNILCSKEDIILSSEELHLLDDTELREKLPRIKVIARALPEDKSRLIRVAQSSGLVVGMTGDGVNDSPALKNADVGFSMGSGTEVAKEAGDIVILDDDFSSIKKAILYGRTIYNSIKKFITFQLTINVAAVSVSVIGLVVGVFKPLSITQMLWVNLVMDTLAAIAFGGEPALKKYLLEKPKKRDEAILDKKMWSAIITDGFFICIVSVIMFMSENIHNLFRADAKDLFFFTGYFSFFVFSGIFNAFNTRTEGIDLTENLSRNKSFLVVMGLVALIQVLMTYFGGSFLRTAGLNFKEWLIVIILSFLVVPVDIIRKLIIK